MKLLRLLPLVLLMACSKLSEVRVSNQNFADQINLAQNLVFTFNKDLVSQRELDAWTSTPYLEFSPKVAGKFKWTAPNELVFSPATGFSPATAYKANLSERVLDGVKAQNWRLAGEDIAFHTPYLEATAPEVYWTKSKPEGKPVARVKMTFNYAVNPSALVGKLSAEVEGKALIAQVAPSMTAAVVPVTLPNVPTSRESLPVKLTLAEGIAVPNTTYKTDKPTELTAQLPSPFTLDVVDVQSGFEGGKGFLRVITTQELRADALPNAYSLTSAEPEKEVQYDSLGNPIRQEAKTNSIPLESELTENGFILRGPFNESDTYTLTLSNRLTGVLGARLSENFTKDVFFGKMPAQIQFAAKKAIYLSSKGARNVGVQIANIPKVTVKIAWLYENNLLSYLHQKRYQNYDENSGEASKKYSYEEDSEGNMTSPLVTKKIETADLPKRDGMSLLNLSVPDLASQRAGVYLVSVESDQEYYQRDIRVVSVSDIGLTVRQSADELLVYANSIRSAEPLSGVEVSLVSTNNQTMLTGKTNGQGVATFKDLKNSSNGFELALLTARTKEDFNYLLLEDTRVETSRYEVEGRRDQPSGLEAFIYGDRDIYRPGETIHLNAVIRTQAWESVKEVPLKLKLLQPNGRELQSFRLQTNDQGSAELAIPLDKSSVTGTYTTEIYNGNDVLLASRSISIEEFMPDRIKVEVSSDKESYSAGQTVSLSALATNLFGPPAADRNYEMELQLKRRAFTPKGYEAYAFEVEDNTQFEKTLRQGRTDANGRAAEAFPLPATYRDLGILEGSVYVTVFDETGRPVNRLQRFNVYTQPVLFGIRLASSYVSTGLPVPLAFAALDPLGKPANASAQVELFRIDYQTVIERNGDQLKYVSKRQPKSVYSRALTFKAGKAELSYVPSLSGEYEIRIARPGAKAYSVQTFYAYGYGNTQATSFEVDNEGRVEMKFDKEKYTSGDRANVLFTTPFDGKLLVCVERNKVFEYEVINTDQRSAKWSFKLSDENLPNVYVSATLIRPLDDANLPLTVAHGYAPVAVEKPETKLDVTLQAAENSRSKTKQRITVKTSQPNAEVTLAVVDEGILQLKNFRTPDIHGFFYAKRALEVDGFDLYPFLFPELSLAQLSSVGGDGYNLEKRINPLANGRVNLVAFWSGRLRTNGNGEASFDVTIPQFSGDLRIMAVAYKNEAFGSANRSLKVADPLVLSTALPRFLSPGDELTVPVSITNTTKNATNATAILRVSGALEAGNALAQTISLAPGKEGRAVFSLKARKAMGVGSVTVTVKGLNETFTETIDLTVRAASSLLKTSIAGQLTGGQTGMIQLPMDYIPSTTSNRVLISRSPLVSFADKLQDLLGYPYGCLEQTVSKAFPQLYVADFVKTLKSAQTSTLTSGANDQNPNATIQAAIGKIESLQLVNGGLSRWQVGNAADAWSSAYAAHFLLEAQKADFEINAQVLTKLLDFLTTQSGTPATEMLSLYNADGSVSTRKVAKKEVVYGLYVLALGGKANRAVMNYYKANAALLTPDSQYLLATAYAQAGDRPGFQQLLPKLYPTDRTVRETGGSLSSPVRNLALTLNALLETEPDNAQIPPLARLLSTQLKATTYLNTQEMAFTTLALGKLARRAAKSTATATILRNGQEIGAFKGDNLVLSKNVAFPLQIKSAGQGDLFYFAQSEGLSATGQVKEEDSFLRVRRTYHTRDGKPIGTNHFQQNQLIVVKVTVESTTGLAIDNVVVTDLLPAGLEIENPRLTAERELSWTKDQSIPDHFDLRDDRINFFTSVGKKSRTFYYLARAVSKGKFILGPASADAMYRGEYRSYHGAGNVVIE